MAKVFKKVMRNRLFVSIAGMIIGSVIYCFSLIFILQKGNFYAGGVTGISQILANEIFKKPELIPILIAIGNLPLFLIGWKNVSRRFAVLSLSSVLLQVLLTYLFKLAVTAGFDPFKALSNQTLVLAIIGGLLCGAGCAIPLRCGASTGGMDIVSQSFSFRNGVPFTLISGTVDATIIITGAITGGSISIAIYTLVRLIVQLITLDKIHTIYKFQKVTIITDKHIELQHDLIAHFPHGITIYKAVGGFTNTEKWVLESVVFTYELEEYRSIIKHVDEHAFVYYTSIKGIMGNFVRKAI